ncbi:MAG: hypothetical protein FWF79_05610 [Defluviitaleaceae bacterium]|nr:hypothetical protein [Defluviitaleaceae bacterium]
MKERSGFALFLTEQLIVIAVFAICAAVCVKILSVAHTKTVDAVDTRLALVIAENAAEHFKATGFGEIPQKISYFYDADLNPALPCNAAFELVLTICENIEPIIFADISVSRVLDNAELINLTASTRRIKGSIGVAI